MLIARATELLGPVDRDVFPCSNWDLLPIVLISPIHFFLMHVWLVNLQENNGEKMMQPWQRAVRHAVAC